MPINPAIEEKKRQLEEILDKHFPKIEEESEEKRLNKRGEALELFGMAILFMQDIYQLGVSDGVKPVSNEDVEKFLSDEDSLRNLIDETLKDKNYHPNQRPAILTDKIFEAIKATRLSN